MITVKYDKPIEVTLKQYLILRDDFAGIVAHRQEKGRYWIKQLWPGYREEIEKFLNQ